MSSFSVLFLFVAIIILLFLVINFILAPSNPYQEKLSSFSHFHQSRSPFHLSFFIYASIYLVLDLEIILLYPYAMSTYVNGVYDLVIMLIFTLVLTVGFVYELGSGALHIGSRQYNSRSSFVSSNLANFPNTLKSQMFTCNILGKFSHSLIICLSIRRSFSTSRSSTSNN